MQPLSRRSWRRAPLLLTWWLVACGGADDPGAVEDRGNADRLIESVLPEPGSVAARNQPISVLFRHAVLLPTLALEVAGAPVDVATLDEREFRFVPFPLHEAGTEYDVRIVAGVEDVTGQILDHDYAWSFSTVPEAVEEQPPPPLTDAEIALIESGDGSTPLDLVTNYDDPASPLYEISLPIEPIGEHFDLLVDRMLTSVAFHGGVGLAAPQIGINRRLFVAEVDGPARAFVNPAPLAWSEVLSDMKEGCLSVPDQDLNVQRPTWIEYAYGHPDGTFVDLERLENTSLFRIPARIWLHEFDHLNGILMTDRATSPPPL